MSAWRGLAAAALSMCLASGAGAADLQEGRDFNVINPPLATGLSGVLAAVEQGRYQIITLVSFEEPTQLVDRLIDGVRAESCRK